MQMLREKQDVIVSAEIIAVGTELLTGQVLNTNAHYLAQRLGELGISVYHSSVVGDNAVRLKEALDLALSRADLVVTSGGLGPTEDDITMEVAAKAGEKKLSLHEPTMKRLRERFLQYGRKMSKNNEKQALLPEGALIMPNTNGTAPGAIIETHVFGNIRRIALLPGPPSELYAMFESELAPYIQARSTHRFIHRYLRLAGIGESAAVEAIADLIRAQGKVTIAPYATDGTLTLRVSERIEEDGSDDTEAVVSAIRARLEPYIFGEGDLTLASAVLDRLREKGRTLALAESMTGGAVAAALTEVPGASDVFVGAAVTYQTKTKTNLLGVDAAWLEQEGAVNEETAKQMANGARDVFQADLALSVTGLAGPGTGDEPVSVGTVWLAVADGFQVKTRKLTIRGERKTVIARTVICALDLIRQVT
jgi:nicotinamide-nucleotide amidase